MITVFVRLRVENWERFVGVHDDPRQLQRREENGNMSHRVLSQLDDVTDVVFLDTWSSPQDSDSYYHTDEFAGMLQEMGASVVEMIKLEDTQATQLPSA